jgi:hypothetical protein
MLHWNQVKASNYARRGRDFTDLSMNKIHTLLGSSLTDSRVTVALELGKHNIGENTLTH